MEELRQYLERCQVAASPSNAGTPPEVLQEIVRRTGEAMASCMQALNLGGLKLQHLMDAIETRCGPGWLPLHAPACIRRIVPMTSRHCLALGHNQRPALGSTLSEEGLHA